MHLFDKSPRVDAAPMQRGESHFEFLNRVATPYWQRVRDVLEFWFAHYPLDDRPDLAKRFRSKLDDQHLPAFWELYLHEGLCSDGWQVGVHPPLPGISRRLDFLATRDDDTLLLEATAIVKPLLSEHQHRLLQAVLKAVDATETSDFSLGVDYLAVGGSAPPTRQLRRELKAWLEKLDRVTILEELKTGHAVTACPEYHWTPAAGWHLLFRAYPLRDGASSRPGFRAVGMSGPGTAYDVDHDGPLRGKLIEKLQGLKHLPHPLVIAILDLSEYPLYPSECDRTLYGQTVGVYDPVTLRETHAFRADDGFWSSGGTRSRDVSGVLVSSRLRPWSVCGREGATPALWLNPNPTYRAPTLPWPTFVLAADGLNVDAIPAAKAMHELFGVSPEWPGPGPAFPV